MDERIDPVIFRLGTKEYKLVLTSPAARMFETLTGVGVLEAKIGHWTQTITLLFVCAMTNSPHLRLDALFTYATLADLPEISKALGEAVKRAFQTDRIADEAKAGEPGPLGS